MPNRWYAECLARDPEGKATKPTARDRATFKTWVITTYGREAWDIYTDNGQCR